MAGENLMNAKYSVIPEKEKYEIWIEELSPESLALNELLARMKCQADSCAMLESRNDEPEQILAGFQFSTQA